MKNQLKIPALILAACVVAVGAFLAFRPDGLVDQKREKEANIRKEIQNLEEMENLEVSILSEESSEVQKVDPAEEPTEESVNDEEKTEETSEAEEISVETEVESKETEEEREKRLAEEEEKRRQGFETIFDEIESDSAVLIRYRDDYLGGVVAELNPDATIDPGSTTQLMTCLIAAEELDGSDTLIEITEDAVNHFLAMNASVSGFTSGEMVTLEDCIYGILLRSGCDACLAIAEKISGSEEEFVELMNKKAAELGMMGTHYANSTGLGTSDHYICANDLAILLQACYENDLIFEVLSCVDQHQTQPTDVHDEGITLVNITEDWFYDYPDDPVKVLGCKTGAVSVSGRNLASIVEADDEIYFLITMGAPFDSETSHYRDQVHILDDLAMRINDHLIAVETE